MMRKLAALSLATLMLVLAGCGGTKPAPAPTGAGAEQPKAAPAKTKEVEIAIVGPLSGDYAVVGQQFKEGAELAFSAVNEAGGVNGVTFKLVTYDDRANATEATNIARRLAGNDNVLAVIGHYTSGTVFAAQGIYDQAKIPHFTPSASHPDLTKKGTYTFRMWSSIGEYQPQGAEYAVKKLGMKKQAIIYANNDWGKASYDAWTAKVKELGGEVVLTEKILDGDKDFKSQLTKVQNSGADSLVLLTYYTEGALLSSQARTMGIQLPIAGSGTFLEPEFLKIAGKAAEGIIFNTEFHEGKPDKTVQEFVKLFQSKSPGKEIKIYHPTSYDAARLIIDAVKANGADREKIRSHIVKLKDFPGVTGAYTFGEARDPKKENVFVIIKDGKFQYHGN
ncbi:MAG: ABC transporter substrate-binding protein [Bacillota bacterium]